MINQISLLLTASIDVKNKDLVKRNITAQRLNDYRETLKKWLTRQKSLSSIVFVENSGYPLDELKKIVAENNPFKKEVEFLQYNASGKDLTDKSYAEITQVMYALMNSKLMKSSTHFAQVSGRAYMPNIDLLTAGLPDPFDVVARFENNLAYLATNLVFFKNNFFRDFVGPYSLAHVTTVDNYYEERVYAGAIHLAIEQDYRWYPFCEEPIVEGIGGTKNKDYGRGRWFALKNTWIEKLYYNLHATSYGKNRKHLMEIWNLKPKSERK